MEFGVFDLVERNGLPLPQFYEERLALCEAYDRLGFFCYHIAEHHASPHDSLHHRAFSFPRSPSVHRGSA